MKTSLDAYQILIFAFLLSLGSMANSYCQSGLSANGLKASRLTIGRVKLDSLPEQSYMVPLKDFGFKSHHQVVLVKVRPLGDSLFYPLPGMVPGGNSFGVILQTGNRHSGDTLQILRRAGSHTDYSLLLTVFNSASLNYSTEKTAGKSFFINYFQEFRPQKSIR